MDRALNRVLALLGAGLVAATVAVVAIAGTPGSKPDSKSGAPAGGGAAPGSGPVAIKGFKFMPEVVETKAGTKLTFTNRDSAPHTATSDDDTFDTGTLEQGKSKSVMLRKPGSYAYHCALHPYMKAKVTVR